MLFFRVTEFLSDKSGLNAHHIGQGLVLLKVWFRPITVRSQFCSNDQTNLILFLLSLYIKD